VDADERLISELEGSWKVVSWEQDGQTVPVASVYDKVVIWDDKYLAYRGDEVVAFFILKKDGSEHPRPVDFTHPAEQLPFMGIYAREGEALKLCWDGNRPGKRPTTFTGAHSCMYLQLLALEAFTAEAAHIQGKWAVLEMEQDGARVPTRLTALEIAGDQLILMRSDQARLVMAFSLNPLTNPRSFEIVVGFGDDSKFSMIGIYAFDGDQLRLCWHDSGHGLPAGFETRARTPASSFLLQRAEVPAN
jgi:uncharacterized protein (TIGR03067 family)